MQNLSYHIIVTSGQLVTPKLNKLDTFLKALVQKLRKSTTPSPQTTYRIPQRLRGHQTVHVISIRPAIEIYYS